MYFIRQYISALSSSMTRSVSRNCSILHVGILYSSLSRASPNYQHLKQTPTSQFKNLYLNLYLSTKSLTLAHLHSSSSCVHDPGLLITQYSEPAMLGEQHLCPESARQMSTNWPLRTREGSSISTGSIFKDERKLN